MVCRERRPIHHTVLCRPVRGLFKLCFYSGKFHPGVCHTRYRRPNIRVSHRVLHLLHLGASEDRDEESTVPRIDYSHTPISGVYPHPDPGTGLSSRHAMHVPGYHIPEKRVYSSHVHRELRSRPLWFSVRIRDSGGAFGPGNGA